MPPLAYFPSRNQYAPETSTNTIAGSSLAVKRCQSKLEPAVCEPGRRGPQFFRENAAILFRPGFGVGPNRSPSGINSPLAPRPVGRSLAAQRSIIVISSNAHAPRNCWCISPKRRLMRRINSPVRRANRRQLLLQHRQFADTFAPNGCERSVQLRSLRRPMRPESPNDRGW